MTKTLHAIVEGGILRPLEKLGLPENEHVLVTIVPLGQHSARPDESAYDAAVRLGIVGLAKNTPPDLSSNPDHLNGFGS